MMIELINDKNVVIWNKVLYAMANKKRVNMFLDGWSRRRNVTMKRIESCPDLTFPPSKEDQLCIFIRDDSLESGEEGIRTEVIGRIEVIDEDDAILLPAYEA